MTTPEGFTTVNTYILANDPIAYIDFLQKALGGELKSKTMHDGQLANAQVRMGESIVMVGQARGEYPATRSMLYYYVEDVDGDHKKALENGAKEIHGPIDMPYGDRQSLIEDPEGNLWCPAKRFDSDAFNSDDL